MRNGRAYSVKKEQNELKIENEIQKESTIKLHFKIRVGSESFGLQMFGENDESIYAHHLGTHFSLTFVLQSSASDTALPPSHC